MTYWAKAPVPREQIVLISTTLDDRIPDDHVVRVFSEVLAGYDWSTWEAHYHQGIGQPPIHPRVLATVWLYGLRRGVRSSRRLEYMIKHNVDFMWLSEGHTPDHATLSAFRTKFGDELKDLFRHIARVAMEAGFLKLIELATDGTRVKANNSRFETWTAERIAKALEEGAIADVAAYYAGQPQRNPNPVTLAESPPAIVQLVELGDPKRNIPPCAACHRAAAGGPIETPVLAEQWEEYIAQQLRLYASGERRNDVYARMRTVASRLTAKMRWVLGCVIVTCLLV